MPLRRSPSGQLAVLTVPRQAGVDTEAIALLRLQLRFEGFPEARTEYRALADRRFRFDLAWPAERIALELDGGVYTQGRHTRGAGFENDCRKFNLAASTGWTVFRVTPNMVEHEWPEIVRIMRAAFALRRND